MKIVREETSVPLSEIYSITHKHSTYSTPYYIQEYIEGNYPSTSTPLQYSRELGSYLAELHNIDVPPNLGIGWMQYTPEQGFETVDGHTDYKEVYIHTYNEYLDDLTPSHRFKDIEGELSRYLEQIKEEYTFHSIRSYCHTDLKVENILVNGMGNIMAILDWESPLIGSPLYDVQYAQMRALWEFPDQYKQAFRSEYENKIKYDIMFEQSLISEQMKAHRLLFLFQEIARFPQWYSGYSEDKQTSREEDLREAIKTIDL